MKTPNGVGIIIPENHKLFQHCDKHYLAATAFYTCCYKYMYNNLEKGKSPSMM
jgi:hypothetical protein